MDLTYDGLYRMYMLGEFELPRSNISYPLVEYALYEIENLRVGIVTLILCQSEFKYKHFQIIIYFVF